MTAAALLAQLSGLGVSAWADGAVLRFKPASLVPPAVLADLRAHKAEVLALLTVPVAAAAVVAPPQTILSLIPADPGYLARHPVQAVPAPSPAQPMAHWPPGSWRKRRYTSDLADMLWTTMARSISWADPAARPEEGSFCGNCECRVWARDKRRTDGGWCCSICHPPDDVPVEHRDVVRW